jgi:hypothetical protein
LDVLTVRAVQLRDADGTMRATFGLLKEGKLAADGVPALVLRGKDGSVRAAFDVSPNDTADLILNDPQTGRPTVALAALPGEPTAASPA